MHKIIDKLDEVLLRIEECKELSKIIKTSQNSMNKKEDKEDGNRKFIGTAQ